MANKTLRSLAKDYAQGKINQDKYRKIRSELIDGILDGKIIVEAIDFPPPLDLDEGDPTVESAVTQIKPEQFSQQAKPQQHSKPQPAVSPSAPSKESHHHWLIGSGIVALVCLVVLFFLFAGQKEPETQDTSSITVKIPDKTTSPTTVDTLISNFLSKNDWSDKNRQKFISNWQKLSIQEQTAGLNSVAIGRLSNAIYKQLSEERALLGLGDNASAIAKQQTLVNFANQIGINDDRLVVEGTDEQSIMEEEENAIKPAAPVLETESEREDPQTQVITSEPEVVQDQPKHQVKSEIQETLVKQSSDENAGVDPAKNIETLANAGEATVEPVKKKSVVNKNACHIDLSKSRKPYCRDVIDGIGNGPTLVVIQSGKFVMGGEKNSELPTHEVTIENSFALSVSEITYGEYQLFCEATQRTCPEQPWVGKDYPVVNISWHDALDYLKWLSEQTGNLYRLPSEAEWEYAARAGTSTTYPFGEEILITDAVFSDRKELTSPLPKTDRSINRNNFRLYHMMGNVREWVADNWQENYSSALNNGAIFENGGTLRVVRGGSYNDSSDALRSGARDKLEADTKDNFTGFRILQEINN